MSLIRRRATLDDIPRMVEMGEAFTTAVAMPIAFDAAGFAEQLAKMIEHPGAFVQVIDNGELGAVGGIGGLAGQHMLFPAVLTATELFWWIEPEFRGSTQALRLVTDFEEWAAGLGCVVVAVSMFVADGRVQTFLERRGFVHYESSFVRRLAA